MSEAPFANRPSQSLRHWSGGPAAFYLSLSALLARVHLLRRLNRFARRALEDDVDEPVGGLGGVGEVGARRVLQPLIALVRVVVVHLRMEYLRGDAVGIRLTRYSRLLHAVEARAEHTDGWYPRRHGMASTFLDSYLQFPTRAASG